jgi:outer membrane translocation and assembly module TamA
VGAGVRLNTPFALIRVDLGMPLPRLAGEPRARWYFSLGHVF